MARRYQRQYMVEIKAPVEEVWAFHGSIDSLFVLTPPSFSIELEESKPPMRVGSVYRLLITRFGISIRWTVRIVEYEPPYRFVDVADHSPFAYWEHRHEFVPVSDETTRLTDTVIYTPPGGLLAPLLNLIIRWDLDRMFAYRHRIAKEQLDRSDL